MILYNFFYGMYFPPIDPDRIHYLKDYFEYLLYLTFREPPEDQKLYVHHIVPRSFLPELWRNRARGRWNNVILVTKEEHHKLHSILTYVYPTSGMAIANLKMYNNNKELAPESVRKEAGQVVSEKSKKYYAEHPEARQHLSDLHKGRCFINNGVEERFVHPEEAEQLVALGTWDYGMIKGRKKSEETKAKMRGNCGKHLKGRKHMHNPITGETTQVKPEEIQTKLDEGWILGRGKIVYTKKRKYTGESLERIRNMNKNRVMITDGYSNKNIKKEEVEEYLSKGWRKGRILSEKELEGARKRLREHPIGDPKAISDSNQRRRGYKVISKDGINKQIRPEQLDSYLSQGWTLGLKSRTKTSV